jgi:hypothetical protein
LPIWWPMVATRGFRGLDVSMLPELRAIRRAGPGWARRGALLALLHLGGEKALDPADLVALRRLITIKLPHDRPQQFDDSFCAWLTVPGGDQRGIMRVLGLNRSAPATYGLGGTLVGHLGHGGPERHVFISPQLNGWTVVAGPSCSPYRQPQIDAWIRQLSSIYGQAQSYFFGSQSAADAWLVGSRGRIVRRFSYEEPETSTGEPLPIELRALRRLGLTGPPERLDEDDGDDLPDFIGECGGAPQVAAELSIAPVWTGWPADLEVHGQPLIAWPGSDDDVSILRGGYFFEI